MPRNLLGEKLVKDVGHCELCGSSRNLEAHHVIPKCCAIDGVDLDVEDNLIVTCYSCHAKLTPKALLTKYGVRKTMNCHETAKRKMLQFYKEIEDCEYRATVDDLIDIVEHVFADYRAKE